MVFKRAPKCGSVRDFTTRLVSLTERAAGTQDPSGTRLRTVFFQQLFSWAVERKRQSVRERGAPSANTHIPRASESCASLSRAFLFRPSRDSGAALAGRRDRRRRERPRLRARKAVLHHRRHAQALVGHLRDSRQESNTTKAPSVSLRPPPPRSEPFFLGAERGPHTHAAAREDRSELREDQRDAATNAFLPVEDRARRDPQHLRPTRPEMAVDQRRAIIAPHTCDIRFADLLGGRRQTCEA